MIRGTGQSDINRKSSIGGHRAVFLAVILTFPLLLASCGGPMMVDPLVEAEESITTGTVKLTFQGEFMKFRNLSYQPVIG